MKNKVYQKKEEDSVICLLCPHFCKLKEGERGKCYARQNISGNIVLVESLQYTNIAVEPIEKKPFVKYLQNTKTLSIGGLGCHFNCKYCENYIVSQKYTSDNYKISINKIIEYAKQYNCKSICFTYNEPTIYYEDIILISEEVHKNNLKVLLKTNGYVNKEPWGDICSIVDAINLDIKGGESEYKNVCGIYKGNKVVQNRLLEACLSGVHIEVNIPIYEDYKDINYFKNNLFVFNSFIQKRHIPVHLVLLHSNKKDFIADFNINKIKEYYKNNNIEVDIVE